MRRYLLALPLLVASLGFAACGSSSSDATPTPTIQVPTEAPTEAATATPAAASGGSTGGTTVKVTGELGKKPKITVPGGTAPSKLVIKDIKKGTGPAAKTGDTVTVQYDGVLFDDGTEFDASWNRPGQPFSFPLGAGQVIPGWDQGLVGMKKGGRRVLTIPPDLAYGPNGSPPAIPANAALVFVVDMESITAD